MRVSTGFGQQVIRALPWVTGIRVFVELLSLRLGLLNAFFFDTAHADVQGIDYFSLPKAWLNLRAGKSVAAAVGKPGADQATSGARTDTCRFRRRSTPPFTRYRRRGLKRGVDPKQIAQRREKRF